MRRAMLAVWISTTLVVGCGGGGGSPPSTPPAVADFSLSASPGSLTVVQGETSLAASISVTALNGFSAPVSVSISGLPAGSTTSPTFPLSMSAGAPQQFTVTVPAAAAIGDTKILLHGVSGSQAHDAAAITLTTTARVVTSQSNGLLYLQGSSNGHTARIGLDTKWGGAIVEVSLDGTNFVNAHDTGREVQPALYDLVAVNGNQGANGWDPVLGGDKYDHGTPIGSQQVTSTSLYTQAIPLHWNPDAFGGGANAPVKSDMSFEQTVTLAPGTALAFKVHLKLTHTGADYHYVADQEFPAVYVNSAYTTLAYYGGTSPWTNGALTSTPVSTTAASVIAPEQWAALTDANGQGLAVFVAGSYPSWTSVYFPQSGGSGPLGDATAYMRPLATFHVGPGAVIEGDIYLIPGDVAAARAIIYALHPLAANANLAEAFGTVDVPATNATLSGAAYGVAGWAVAGNSIAAVNVYVDGTMIGTATLGSARPDVAAAFPGIAPVDCGWQYALDTTTLSNGTHAVAVRFIDGTSNEVLLPPVIVTVSN